MNQIANNAAATSATANSGQPPRSTPPPPFLSFITPSVYTRCTKINYKIVPVTNFNKYLHYGTSGNE